MWSLYIVSVDSTIFLQVSVVNCILQSIHVKPMAVYMVNSNSSSPFQLPAPKMASFNWLVLIPRIWLCKYCAFNIINAKRIHSYSLKIEFRFMFFENVATHLKKISKLMSKQCHFARFEKYRRSNTEMIDKELHAKLNIIETITSQWIIEPNFFQLKIMHSNTFSNRLVASRLASWLFTCCR